MVVTLNIRNVYRYVPPYTGLEYFHSLFISVLINTEHVIYIGILYIPQSSRIEASPSDVGC